MVINKSKELAFYGIAPDKDHNDKNTTETKQIEINISKSNEMGIDISRDLAHDAITLDKAEDDIITTETYEVDLEKVDNKEHNSFKNHRKINTSFFNLKAEF